ERFVRMTDEKFRYGLLSILAESNEGALSQAYYEKVKAKIGNQNFAVVADLLAPAAPSAPFLQRTEFLEMALEAKEGKDVSGKKAEHFKKWQWLVYAFCGPAWKEADFRAEFDQAQKTPKTVLQKEIEEAKGRKAEVERKRDWTMEKYGFDAYEKKMTRVIARFAETKYQRKENFTHAHCEYHAILSEIAKRLGLSIGETRLLTPEETRKALVEGKPEDLSERTTLCAFIHQAGKTKALEKSQAQKWEKVLPKVEVTDIPELKGQCACPGNAKGKAVIVNSEKDVHKLKQGDVLFSYATTPELMAAIRKAGAIVTDRGGVTCHAAIVSRELKIPCVIGTKIGTQWIREGETVHVDASAGRVRKEAPS
ncbi:MAG TPA: PEP-utilizing enzyme, partial [Candidatus Norongarragalinales archaeon]|nr:PEP-utilizing enzyme [Candidatus Norongarragalinales archaeon]